MLRFQRSTFVLTASLVVLLQISNAFGASTWSWTVTPSLTNQASCDIAACTKLYGKAGQTTEDLNACFKASASKCLFTAIGDPKVTTIPIGCAGSATNTVASLDVSALIPPFGDSIYSNGSATVNFKTKPDGSTQCDFFGYVQRWKPSPTTCQANPDDSYWFPDTANGAMTIMTKRFELSLFKVVDQSTTGYFIENANWAKCGGSIDSVQVASGGLKVVVSMAGEVGKASTTSTTPPPKTTPTTSTSKPSTSVITFATSNFISTTTESNDLTTVVPPTSNDLTTVLPPTSMLPSTSKTTTKHVTSPTEGSENTGSENPNGNGFEARHVVRLSSSLGLIVAMALIAQSSSS